MYIMQKKLEDESIVGFDINPDGTFTIMELCDNYYKVTITKEELLALAKEIEDLANGTYFL